jgi:hypothetical protein
MSDQKNIDNLFRETFKDFEASPDPALWDKISSQLDEKSAKKKKGGAIFIPWFYKIAGIAAALLLLFTVGSQFIGNPDNGLNSEQQTTSTTKENTDTDSNSTTKNVDKNDKDSQVTGTETNSEQQLLQDENTTKNNFVNDNEQLVNQQNNKTNSIKKTDGSDTTAQKGNALTNAVVQQNGTNSNTVSQQSLNNKTTNTTVTNNKLIDKENAVANTNSSQRQNSTNTTNSATNNTTQKSSNTVAQHTNNGTNVSKNGIKKGVNSSTTNTNAVAQNDPNKSSNTSKNGVENGVNSSTTNTNAVAQNDPNKSSNTSNETTTDVKTAVTENAVATVKKDEIKKSLLDVINELYELEEDTDVVETQRKKWTISPNASPVYYNSFVNGSPIDETFADNTKSGDVNLSYGVNVGYDVSSRLTIRSGIHKVDYSYSTQGIALVPSLNGNEISTLAFKQDASNFSLQDRKAASPIDFPQYQQAITVESSIREPQIAGDLSQRMSYIEVPVELKYALLDKKFGINVIGGVSTLVLTENSIVLDSPQLLTELGEATNVNNVSFSTNIGFGIDYKVSEQIEFNLEPMLKYQLNTFSGNTGNFKPYSVGVYTGVSFRF